MMAYKLYVVAILFLYSISFAQTKKVIPHIDSLYFNGDGTYTAVFGYSAEEAVTIPKGKGNSIDGQVVSVVNTHPETFQNGKKHNALKVRFTGDKLSWKVNKDSVVAFADSADYSCLRNPPAEVVDEAKNCLKERKNNLCYGYLTADDTQFLELGQPLRLYWIYPEKIREYKNGDHIWSVADTLSKYWLYPITFKGMPMCDELILSRPERKSGRWAWTQGGCSDTITGITHLSDLYESWSAKAGYTPFLVHYATDYLDILYFSVPEKGRFNLTKLTERDESLLRPVAENESVRTTKNLSKSLSPLVESLTAKPKRWANEPDEKKE